MKKILTIAEHLFVIVSLTFFTGGLAVILPSEGMITLTRYLILFIGGLVIITQWKKSISIANQNKCLSILTIIILFSFLWSIYPVETAKDMREVLQMTVFALYFTMRFSLKEQLQIIAFTFSIGILFSIFFAIAVPSIGVHGEDHPGAWKGIYDYKNTFGSMMVLSTLAFFALPIDKPIDHLYKWLGLGLSLTMMLMSTSKTSLVLSFLLILILILYRNFRWQGKITVVYLDIAILIFGCIGTVVFTQWVSLLTGLGRDYTLTGRTLIWEVSVAMLRNSPLLGFGRGAFWAPGSGYAIEAGRAVTPFGYIPPHGHNGFIDLALDVGYIGLSLFLVSFTIAYFRSLKMAYAAKKIEYMWPLAFLTFLAMNNVMESYLVRLANIYWVLYVTVAISLSQNIRK